MKPESPRTNRRRGKNDVGNDVIDGQNTKDIKCKSRLKRDGAILFERVSIMLDVRILRQSEL